MIWVYLLLAIGIASAGFTGVEAYNHAITRATKAEEAAATWRADSEGKKKELEQWKGDYELAEANGEAERKLGDAAKRTAANLARELAALKARDPGAARYLDTPVPESVRMQRRINAGCSPDPKVPCTPRGLGTEGAASDDRRDKPGAAPGEQGSEKRPSPERSG